MSGRLARETSDDDGYSSIGECETFFFRPQIRAGFFRDFPLSHRAQHGNYLKYVRKHGISSGLYAAMVDKAYGHRLLQHHHIDFYHYYHQDHHHLQ